MKKKFLTILTIMLIFVVTGCRTERLVCTLTHENTESESTHVSKITAKFSRGEVTEIETKDTTTYRDNEYASKMYENYQDNPNDEIETKLDGNVITRTWTIENAFGEATTRSQVKEVVESMGYTCN